MKKVIVIGGGAAGMTAAIFAGESGTAVTLLEKNGILGKKLLITGKGRCNLTNSVPAEDILGNIPGNPSFLYSAVYSFGSSDTVRFFNSIGLETKVERGNRVFPVSDRSADVVGVLRRKLRDNGVTIKLNSPVMKVNTLDGTVTGVTLAGGEVLPADSVVIATGGLSYPSTGSDGDGYRFARDCGHSVTELHPSLVGLKVRESFVSELQGLSLKNIGIRLSDNGKAIYRDFGEMLFTHYGVSGPVILSASRHVTGRGGDFVLSVDLKPALDERELDCRLLRDFTAAINKNFANSLNGLLPNKMIPVMIALSGIAPEKKVNLITKEERKRLCVLLKNFPMTVAGTADFVEAVVTAGGVSVNEINPSTMESKLVGRLFFAGEVIDVDGYTGGFNLQIAFSTGYLAGINSITG